MTRRVFKSAFIASLPVLMGYLAMGMAAGIVLAGTVKITALPFWAFLSSSVTISGALQFIMAEWASVLTPLSQVALLTFCLNVRYAMYGLSLIGRFHGIPWYQKAYLIWAMTDETYALQVENRTPEGENPVSFCIAVAMLDHFYWICGVVAGSVIGRHLPFDSRGVDFAMTALFLVVLTDQCRDKENRTPAVIGLTAAAVSRLFFPVENMLIPAMVMMVAALTLMRKKLDKTAAAEKETGK